MTTTASTPTQAAPFPKAWTWGAVAGIVVITVLHYGTHGGVGNVETHTLFRRLYYLPIAVLAVVHGRRGAWAGVAVALLYIPHAFMGHLFHDVGMHLHADPAPAVEKVAEVVLYVALGALVGFAVDRAREAQAQLADAQLGLQRSARLSALGELVAGVAHEIRNPLASLHASAEMFLDAFGDDDENHRLAELNFDEVKRLEEIVTRFLEYARPSPPRREQVDLADLIQRVQALAASTAREANVDLSVDGEAKGSVEADGAQLVQVLLNLALNAIEATPAGKRVVLRAEQEARHCRFVVDDEGPGVDTADRDKIFDPFYTTRAEGTGLGLSVVQQLVHGHEGDVVVETSPLGGARFTVRLPLGTPPLQEHSS